MNFDHITHCEKCGKLLSARRAGRHERLKKCDDQFKKLRGTRNTNGAQPKQL